MRTSGLFAAALSAFLVMVPAAAQQKPAPKPAASPVAAPAAPATMRLSFPAAESPVGAVTVDREGAGGAYQMGVKSDRIDEGRRIVDAPSRPSKALNPTIVTALAADGAVFTGWGDDANCPATTLDIPSRWPASFPQRLYNPRQQTREAECAPGRKQTIQCGVGADCGVYGTEARAAFRFEPVFAESFVEVGLVADAARAPGVRIRVEGGGLSAPAHVAAGVSRRFDVAVNGALTLSAETCDAAGAACAAAPVIWPAALCDPPAGVRGGPGPNPRATCVVTNRSGRVAVVAYHRPAWSFDVRSRPLIAGQVRIIGSHRDGEKPQAPQTHILDCPSACGTIVAKPGVVRIGARFTNQPARPDAAADVCGIPKAADAPHLDADALAAIRRGVRLFSETEPWGAVSWICEYTVPADFPAAHFNVRFP